MWRVLVGVWAIVCASCLGPAGPGLGEAGDKAFNDADAGVAFAPDGGDGGASPVDADAGEFDAGQVDGGSPDAGPTDAGFNDAGPTDAGLNDAGEVDAGEVDAGAPDAGKISCSALTNWVSPCSYCDRWFHHQNAEQASHQRVLCLSDLCVGLDMTAWSRSTLQDVTFSWSSDNPFFWLYDISEEPPTVVVVDGRFKQWLNPFEDGPFGSVPFVKGPFVEERNFDPVELIISTRALYAEQDAGVRAGAMTTTPDGVLIGCAVRLTPPASEPPLRQLLLLRSTADGGIPVETGLRMSGTCEGLAALATGYALLDVSWTSSRDPASSRLVRLDEAGLPIDAGTWPDVGRCALDVDGGLMLGAWCESAAHDGLVRVSPTADGWAASSLYSADASVFIAGNDRGHVLLAIGTHGDAADHFVAELRIWDGASTSRVLETAVMPVAFGEWSASSSMLNVWDPEHSSYRLVEVPFRCGL